MIDFLFYFSKMGKVLLEEFVKVQLDQDNIWRPPSPVLSKEFDLT